MRVVAWLVSAAALISPALRHPPQDAIKSGDWNSLKVEDYIHGAAAAASSSTPAAAATATSTPVTPAASPAPAPAPAPAAAKGKGGKSAAAKSAASAAAPAADTKSGPVMVTLIKKGRAPLDPYLPAHLKTSCHVYESGADVYDAMLNQTNIGQNNNKVSCPSCSPCRLCNRCAFLRVAVLRHPTAGKR